MAGTRHVLITVLNWGLGHAARCVPLIRQCQLDGMDITIGSDGKAMEYLKSTFPEAKFLELPDYKIYYATGKLLVPRLFTHFLENGDLWTRERKAVAKYIAKYPTQLIISDSRLGCYHPEVKSVFLTHQLNPFTKFQSMFGGRWYQRKLKRFNEVWLPDTEQLSLSGKLGSNRWKLNVQAIGYLSQYQKIEGVEEQIILGIASGPEPHCTRLLQKLVAVLSAQDKPWRVVHSCITELQHEHVVRMPQWSEMNTLMNLATVVIGNCGYSTLMDLAVMDKRAMLFPTRGQQEQEYLAKLHLEHKKWVVLGRFDEKIIAKHLRML